MATTTTMMQLHGMAGLQQALRETPDLARLHISNAIAKSTVAMARRMQALAPVRSGILKSDIVAQLPRASGLRGQVMIQPRAFYWRFLEYGTRNMRAQPFVRPAAEAESAAFVDAVRDSLKKLERDWSGGRFV